MVKALTTSPIDSRAFRAGVIYNPLRGLTFNEMNNNLKYINNKDDGKIKIICKANLTKNGRLSEN